MTKRGEVFHDYTTDASNRNSFESSFYTMQKMHGDAQHRVWELEAVLREIYEVYAGSEGIPQPMTAAEGYLLHLVKEMANTARAALGEKKDD